MGPIEAYLLELDPVRAAAARLLIERMRRGVPEADERVQWGIAVLSLGHRDIIGLAVRKGFFSLYAPNSEVTARFMPELGKVDAGKGCIRFRSLDDLNLEAFDRMVAALAPADEAAHLDAAALERARAICLALPEAYEQEAWGEPTFRVGKRMYAMFASGLNHHGNGRAGLWFCAPLGAQEALLSAQPDRYFAPPYVGPKGWVGAWLDASSDDDLAERAAEAYRMVAPKKLLARLRDEDPLP